MKIVFMGTPDAAVPSLERCVADGHDVVCVYTQPDRPAGRGHRVAAPPVKQAAMKAGLQVLQPVSIRSAEALEAFCSHAADVAVVAAYGRILPPGFLAAYRFGAVNVHFSLLPKYRGAAPVNWAIANCEPETGVSIMQMAEGLDTGPVLLQKATPIGEDETAPRLTQRLAVMGADLLSETLSQLGSISAREQDDAAATYAPMLSRETGVIDWRLSAKEIACRVRAFQPFPMAYTFYRGKKLAIWAAKAADDAAGTAAPGTITGIRGSLDVQCARGSLAITELQPEGKNRMPAEAYINGYRPGTGERLGENG